MAGAIPERESATAIWNVFNSAATRETTLSQFPLVSCLNAFAVGYQGQSSRPRIHSQ